MLTKEDLQILRSRFAAQEHEFHRGNAYLTESAIATRIEEVDPSWTLEIVSKDKRDDIYTIIVRLTIGGVFRDGVGMASALFDKNTGTTEVNEPEKSAATDAFKRAARLFGIGRYILDFPDDIKDMGALKRYLGEGKQNPYSNAPKAPTTDEWNETTAIQFANRCKAQGVNPLKVLDLKERLSEWTGTATEAFAKLPAA